MDCEEFLRQFREALDGKVSENMIRDNVNYYRSYINSQTANGRSEPEVLKSLGDPRLLAKTIEESSKFVSGNQGNQNRHAGGYRNYESANYKENEYTEPGNKKQFRFPGWLITGMTMVAVVLVLVVVFRVFVFLTPVVFAFLIGGVMVRMIRNWWNGK